MQRSDELPPAPGEAHSGQPVDLEYTALPLGDEQRVLLAHDRRLAEYVVSRDAPAQRILRTASTHEDPSLAIQLELRALRQLRRAARAASARRLGVHVAAVGLPFLVAALLGLVGRWVGLIPGIGEPLGTLVGSVGGSVAGLPLAIVISAAPSLWLVQRARRTTRTAAAPLARAETLARASFRVERDIDAFATQSEEVRRELSGILGGHTRVSGERASRAAARFRVLQRLAATHRVASVAAFAAEAADRLGRASAPPRRLVPGLRGRRPHISVIEVLAPYDPGIPRRRGFAVPFIPALVAGTLAAAFAFLAAGVFRLGDDEALLVRANEAFSFPSAAAVLKLPVGFDSPSFQDEGTASVVDRVGIYWAWPRPLADRQIVKLSDRPAPALAPFVGDEPEEFIEVDFRYDVTDLRTFLQSVPLVDADTRIGTFLEFGLAQYLEAERRELEAAQGDEDATATEVMRSGMAPLLDDFVHAINLAGSAGQIGIQVRVEPDFRFSQP